MLFRMRKQYRCACSHYYGKVVVHEVKFNCFSTVLIAGQGGGGGGVGDMLVHGDAE